MKSKSKSKSDNYSEIASKVLINYAIKPQKLTLLQSKGLKTLWKVMYKDTPLCLKRLNQSYEQALFSVNAQIYVFNNGGNVPKILLNEKKNSITEYNGQLFVLYSWIDGRDMDLEDPKDLPSSIITLSKFHVDSIGYEPPPIALISSKLGNWPKQYESMRNRMLKIKDNCLQDANNESFVSYINNIDPIIAICDKAINLIDSSQYNNLCNIDQKECCLSHQDFGTGNVMLSQGKCIVIDLDSVTYDLPARDLRKIIGKRIMKLKNYSIKDIETILKYYETNNTLSKDHKEILRIDLMFPHWFFGLVKTLLRNPKPISSNKISLVAEFEQNKFSILEEWL